jgi:hypothetical protein
MDRLDELQFESAYIEFEDPWFAYRRMIGSIYGITTCYKPPHGGVALRGWNHRLWRQYEEASPEALVEEVFDEVLRRLKQLAIRKQQSDEPVDGEGRR